MERIQEYNAEPVYACMKCMTLYVKHNDEIDISYCGNCSSYMSLKKMHINKFMKYVEMQNIINKFKNKEN